MNSPNLFKQTPHDLQQPPLQFTKRFLKAKITLNTYTSHTDSSSQIPPPNQPPDSKT